MYDFLDYMSQVAYLVDEGKIKFFLISLFVLVCSDQALSLSVNNDEILIAQYEGRDSQLIIPGLHLSISYFLQILQYFCQFFVTLHFESSFESCFRCLLLICLDDLECYEMFCSVYFQHPYPPAPTVGTQMTTQKKNSSSTVSYIYIFTANYVVIQFYFDTNSLWSFKLNPWNSWIFRCFY